MHTAFKAINPAFMVDRDIIVCFANFYKNAPPTNLKT